MGEIRNAYKIFVKELKVRDNLSEMLRWQDDIKMDLKELGYEDIGWFLLRDSIQ
jgi:hypothetical protein